DSPWKSRLKRSGFDIGYNSPKLVQKGRTKVKTIFLLWACVLPVIASEPDGYKYWSAADLKGLAKTLSPKINAQKVATERLADFGNHYILAAHREGSGEAEFHETEADIFVVQSGTATLVVGGKLQNGKTTTPREMRAPSIDG